MTESKFIIINELAIHYRQEGNGTAPTLVFINSLGSDLRIWDAVVPAFADDYTILRYDKRGHGLSEAPPAPYTIQQHTNDLAGLLTALGLSPVVLIGISVGGMIALNFAHRHSAQIRGLVLSDTAAKIGTKAMWNERIITLREKGMTFLGDPILSRWFAPNFATENPAAYRGYYAMLTRTPLDGYTGTCEAIRDADLTPLLGSITAKTLVLCGREDLATPPASAKALAEALPDADYDFIAGAAHLPCIEQPRQMAEKIARFLEKI